MNGVDESARIMTSYVENRPRNLVPSCYHFYMWANTLGDEETECEKSELVTDE